MIQDQESTGELAVTDVGVSPVATAVAPTGAVATASAQAPAPSWWSTSWAGQRPTIGTIPAVQSERSFTHSRVLPAVMVVCGAVALAASTMPWLSANLGISTTNAFGTDHAVSAAFGINGWTSFAVGGVLAMVSALMMVSDERALRALAALAAAGLTAIGGYELIRVLQQIHYAHQAAARLYPALAGSISGRVHVGYGLIMVCGAAGTALVASILEGVSDS